MRHQRESLLQRVYQLWTRPLLMPLDIACNVFAVIRNHADAKKLRLQLPARHASARPVTFLCLPKILQEEIFKLLPTKDR